MVSYAKYQLLRKAEEFSRICSGSNNPFDWITVGGYATCIKDVCENTIWPPCTTNHGYLEIDDMKTMRVCFLKASPLLSFECTIVVSKILAPDMFKKSSMQEVRSIVDERLVMNTFSSQEVIETSHHSINFLLSGCLRDQSTEQLIECQQYCHVPFE